MKSKSTYLKNQEVVLTIDGMNHEGMGVARLAGMAVFVQGALLGEVVHAKLIKVATTYAIARIISIEETSPERQEPFCPVYRRCGGCSLQHMSYVETLRFKHRVVTDSLERLGGFHGLEIKPVMGMDAPYRYRNKAQYPVGVENDQPIAGFYARRSHEIVDASQCAIQHENSEKVRAAVISYMEENNVPAYDEKTGKGLIRHVVSRVGFRTGEVLAMIVATENRLPHAEKLINRLRKVLPKVTGVVLNVNDKPGNLILGTENFILFGNPIIEDKLMGMTFEISPLSFYQVNPDQTEILYRKVLDAADLKGDETVYDLYCGIGTISLAVAKKAATVIGVESVEEAVDTARENAKKNGILNATFVVGTAEEVLPGLMQGVKPGLMQELKPELMPGLIQEGGEAQTKAHVGDKANKNVVIVDPPRRGCEASLLQTIRDMTPEKVIYVSCNPSTLARDLKLLCAADGAGKPMYDIKLVQPVDMFPWTEHVETVVLMSRVCKL